MIQPYKKGKDKTVMIWNCFKDDGKKSDLVFMPGDPDLKWGEDYCSSLFGSSRRTASNTVRTRPNLHIGWSLNPHGPYN